MKYKVKVDNKLYEVELNDLHNQPIIALVDGEPIEVWLESEMGMKPYFAQPGLVAQISSAAQRESSRESSQTAPEKSPIPVSQSNALTAPIPGVVIAVMVSAGDAVSVGQPLLVLEAMKMKNTIRSPRAGMVSKVNVLPGQTVQHQDILIEFSEA
jgi:biotin carboxyl carrier protein